MPLDKLEHGQAESIDMAAWRKRAGEFEAELAKAVVGQARVIRLMTIALFARGHVLLEGDVGVGKHVVRRAMRGDHARLEAHAEFLQHFARVLHHVPVGIGTHDDTDERLKLALHRVAGPRAPIGPRRPRRAPL